MSHKMNKSMMPTEEHEFAFQRLCNIYINELRAWTRQEKLAKAGKADSYPHPKLGTLPDIVAAVIEEGDDWNIDYEIIDDVAPPPIPLTLEQKKHGLASKAHLAFIEYCKPFSVPPLLLGVANIEMGRLAKAQEDGTIDAVGEAKIAEAIANGKKIAAAQEKLAYIEADIHHLTDDNVDQFEIPSFEEV